MDFDLTPEQQDWHRRGAALGAGLPPAATAEDVVRAAAAAGLLEPGDGTLLPPVMALDALATESESTALALALHMACRLSLPADADLAGGTRVGALTLATEQVPVVEHGRLNGGASWVAPLTADGSALLAARQEGDLVACAVRLSSPGITQETIPVAGLRGVAVGHLALKEAPYEPAGGTIAVMARARILVAAVGLGVARRAVREALGSARGTSRGAGGEQTAQGLIADAATELDAAMMLTWKAAAAPLSLGLASMAKLAATLAAQRAVERAAQVVGAESFRQGHVIERLVQDVRALELFAGRTEALREAVALEQL